MIEQIHDACDYLKSKGVTAPHVGVILGTGLGNSFVEAMQNRLVIPYAEIPHFPLPTMSFHKGNFVYGDLNGRMVLAMQGRFHYYEGYSMQQITFPVRVMKFLGVARSEEHTSELQSLMRISYAVFCLKKKNTTN